MKKFLLLMFICLNVFAASDIDTFKVSQVTDNNVISHRLWSDTMTWNRTANDTLLILAEQIANDDTSYVSFEILNWDHVGVLGTYGWENCVMWYLLANSESDFDNLTSWDSLTAVGASSTNPDIQNNMTALPPSKLIRFMAIADGSTNALAEFQLLFIEDYR